MTKGDLLFRIRKIGSGKYALARGPITDKAHRNKVRRPRIAVLTTAHITFVGAVDIHYARIPNQGIGGHASYMATGNELPRHHFTPSQVRPIAGNPHWVNNDARPVSWPAAYVRDGVAGGPHARGLNVDFSATLNFNGTKEIRAVGPYNLTTDTVEVLFNAGAAIGIPFVLQNLPNTVGCCSGIELRWEARDVGAARFTPFSSSRHTLYFLDGTPRNALGFGEQHYFEVIDWACRWAHGQAGAANVLQQILQRFQPVAVAHASGLIYWRNHQAAIAPAQSVADAIKYQDCGIGERKASSCIVFDRLFLNSLAVHGIQAAELKLTPDPTPFFGPHSFYLGATSWAAATQAAHGNQGAPDGWESHWVGAVNTGGGWQLYDPSYGLGPHALALAPNPPAVGQLISIPQPYEALAVLHFPCRVFFDIGVGPVNPPRVEPLASGSPNLPRLRGHVLDIN